MVHDQSLAKLWVIKPILPKTDWNTCNLTISAPILEQLQLTEQDSTIHGIYVIYVVCYIVYKLHSAKLLFLNVISLYRRMKIESEKQNVQSHLFPNTWSAIHIWLMITCQAATLLYEKLQASGDSRISLCLIVSCTSAT